MFKDLNAHVEKVLYRKFFAAVNNCGFRGTFDQFKTAHRDTGQAARASASYAAATRAGYKGSFEQYSKDILGKK